MQTVKIKSADKKEKLQQQHVFEKLDSEVWSSCFELINEELLIEINSMKMLMIVAKNMYSFDDDANEAI